MDYQKEMENAKPVNDLTNVWIGFSPENLDEKLAGQKAEQVELESLDDKDVVIFGYCKKPGKDDKSFMVICLVPVELGHPVVVVTGAQVICKKLEQCAGSGNAWPIKGKIVEKKGSKYNYFDLV